jgi:hypothetical protein
MECLDSKLQQCRLPNLNASPQLSTLQQCLAWAIMQRQYWAMQASVQVLRGCTFSRIAKKK